MTDPHHLLLVGTGPGLGAAIARRFAREGCHLTLLARSEETIAPLFAAPGAPGIVIDNGALATFDELPAVSPEQLADADRAIRNERPDAWREEYRFTGAEQSAVSA